MSPPLSASKERKLDDDGANKTKLKILAMQRNLRKDRNPKKTVYEVQKLLVPTVDKSLISEDCHLIIGVDATPKTLAGYCVDLKNKRIEFYVIKRYDHPWVIHDPNDSSEFEMKNLMFALTVWEKEIILGRRMRIYTDNCAITQAKFDKNNYGCRAAQVLDHLRDCQGVLVFNSNNVAVNRFYNLKLFTQYIQPADDLSRWQICEAVDFLTQFYKIDQENVQGTHYREVNHRRPVRAKAWYKPAPSYQDFLRDAKAKIDCHNCSCPGSKVLTSLRRNG